MDLFLVSARGKPHGKDAFRAGFGRDVPWRLGMDRVAHSGPAQVWKPAPRNWATAAAAAARPPLPPPPRPGALLRAIEVFLYFVAKELH